MSNWLINTMSNINQLLSHFQSIINWLGLIVWGRSYVILSGHSGFLQQENWLSWDSNIELKVAFDTKLSINRMYYSVNIATRLCNPIIQYCNIFNLSPKKRDNSRIKDVLITLRNFNQMFGFLDFSLQYTLKCFAPYH